MKIVYRLWIDEAGHRQWLAVVKAKAGGVEHSALPKDYGIQFRPDTFPVGTVLTVDVPEEPPRDVMARFRELLESRAGGAPVDDREKLEQLVDKAVQTLVQGQAQVASVLLKKLVEMGLAVELEPRVESEA